MQGPALTTHVQGKAGHTPGMARVAMCSHRRVWQPSRSPHRADVRDHVFCACGPARPFLILNFPILFTDAKGRTLQLYLMLTEVLSGCIQPTFQPLEIFWDLTLQLYFVTSQ